MIKIKNLTKIYTSKNSNNQVKALDNINLNINKGDIYGIIGFSGAGKSSLLRCINLLETPTKGEILLDNIYDNENKYIDVTKLSSKELRNIRKKISVVFQHFNLLMNSTVYDNIAFPLKLNKISKEEINKKVTELLELVGLSDKKDFYPSMLSGGQKQRVGIARALANNPKIILCDEATSALDPTTTDSILNLLKEINKKFNITIVLITHEMKVIKKLCNKVAVMEKGKIVEEGLTLDVFSNPKANITKKFLKENISIPNYITTNENQSNTLLRLKFKGEKTTNPIVSKISRLYDVDIDIICGNIEIVQNVKLGNLIVRILGDEEKIKKSIDHLKSLDIGVEVL